MAASPLSPVRPAAVAGRFYPGSQAELGECVDALLAQASLTGPATAKAIVAPHAGYIYSGSIAATAFRHLRAADSSAPLTVFLLGPPHRVAVRGFALPEAHAFSTPLGHVELDSVLVDELLSHSDVRLNAAAHREEHSLEVELPFLQRIFGPELRILPLLVGAAAPERVAELLEPYWTRTDVRFVFSSDLSHFLDYQTAKQRDEHTIARLLEARRPDLDGQDACGCSALNGLMALSTGLGLPRRLLCLENSGDHTGPKSRVVGYGALAYEEPS